MICSDPLRWRHDPAEAMGVRTGIDLRRLIELGQLGERILGQELHSHVVKTGLVKR